MWIIIFETFVFLFLFLHILNSAVRWIMFRTLAFWCGLNMVQETNLWLFAVRRLAVVRMVLTSGSQLEGRGTLPKITVDKLFWQIFIFSLTVSVWINRTAPQQTKASRVWQNYYRKYSYSREYMYLSRCNWVLLHKTHSIAINQSVLKLFTSSTSS